MAGGDLWDRIGAVVPDALRSRRPVVPVVRLQGTIGIGMPLRPALTISGIADALDRAFSVRNAAEVALIINSPGGSPVQSHLIYRRIRMLADEHGVEVTAFVEDAAASGGYMLACAADRIIADPSSIVGSIGVVSASFGFERLIDKIGVERRLHTSGGRKSMLDPFLPEKPDDVARLEAIQGDVHRSFIDLVRERRGRRLAGDEALLFSGEFWVGARALDLGLIDGLGDIRATLRARHGEDVRIRMIGGRRPFLARRLLGVGTDGVAPGLGAELVSALEARALWARLGL